MARVVSVQVLDGFQVELGFADGSCRRVDLEPYLRGPIFEPLRRDPAAFRAVRVDAELGTIAWPNGADLDPDVLFHGRRPAAWGDPIA
jgi:uncharacterized protein DUF2442